MIYDDFFIQGFEPLRLTVEGLGPFREQTWSFDFTDANREPCNFFLFMSENGRGKTTLLELMAVLMNMLEHRHLESFGHEGLDRGDGRAQWDIRLRMHRDGRDESVVLSLLAGSLREDVSLKVWTDDDLQKVGAGSWHRMGFRRRGSARLEAIGEEDSLVEDFVSAIRSALAAPPSGFEDNPSMYPTLLYFSAYRNIAPIRDVERSISRPADWGYKPVHSFLQEGEQWARSLDNLLVWLKWLDDGRFERARSIINERVFEGSLKFFKSIQKDPPEAVVINGNQKHRLDQLSSGEKSLVQLFLRIGAHMTRNTIILIDEMDIHLHTRWLHRLLNQLKQMAKDLFPGLTIIVSTHSRELLEGFAFEVEEKNLRKGGHIIEPDDPKQPED